MKVLLHICCAPCAIYPVQRLRQEKAQITGFFYNPNIHPPDEYDKRKQALAEYSVSKGLEVIIPDYDDNEYFNAIENGKRCISCWDMRLRRTADFAKENGFDSFTTTLLVSPYQDHQEIKKIGEEVAESKGLSFFYEDFRQGFRQAQSEAKQLGLYRQKYCGCIYSLDKGALKNKRI